MNDFNMGIFSCCRGCLEEKSDVELKDADVIGTPDADVTGIPEYSIRGKKKHPVDKYTTSIEFDKNDRKIETRLYNQDFFTPLGINMISETFIYTLNDPDKVTLRIRLYDHGGFLINRSDYTISCYVVIDMDNPMNCYFSRFIDDLAEPNSDSTTGREIMYSMTNERWLKEWHNVGECPNYGFKIIVSEQKKKHTYEIGWCVS